MVLGYYSKDPTNVDYVPTLFSFNTRKNTGPSQREMRAQARSANKGMSISHVGCTSTQDESFEDSTEIMMDESVNYVWMIQLAWLGMMM